MKSLKLAFISLFLTMCSCGQKTKSHKVNPAAVNLNEKAMTLLQFTNNRDSSIKALELLDSAILIDSNYFLGYYNKLIILNELNLFDKSIHTLNKLIQLRPNANDLYLTGGMLYEKTGDTSIATTYFIKSLQICDAVLDTMNVKNNNYDMLSMNKAINMIMLGDSSGGSYLLKQL